jgi:nitrite reductase/ring-hydroxylating ferredoxin subunit
MATHVPLNRVLALQNQLAAFTSYTMAFGLGSHLIPEGLFWDTEEPYHYIRRVQDKDRQLLLVGGEDHPTGQEPATRKRFDALEAYARRNFDVRTIEYQGSGEVYASADGLPYIGLLPGMTCVQVATGFSGTGLTFGTVAGMLMADLVLERPSPWGGLYRPSRATGHLTIKLPDGSPDVPVGEGRLMEINGTMAAVYRDEHEALHAFSSACTHMGCCVQWNEAARSWDCPCHGGRFRPTGEVLCAPPTQALQRLGAVELGQHEENVQ